MNAFKNFTARKELKYSSTTFCTKTYMSWISISSSGSVEKNDYRLGVRLVFLYALKTLSDKGLIQWDQGKTNHDYLNELRVTELQKGFNELNFYFEYAWYGNFNITPNVFSHVRRIFEEWKRSV